MESFEEQLRKDLHQFLLSMKEVDERMPECPDVEDKWEEIAKAYIPDGIREFQDFPSASLGWMMYIGMAVAKMWDTEWEIYSKIEDLYAYMRDKRGYDAMDEYIREEVLLLQGVDYTVLEKVTGECASRVYNALMHQRLEPGTKEAFNGYVACLHQLYLFGTAMQLKRMGYHMTKMAEGFARDMVQYSAESIAEMLGCSQQIAAQNRLRYMRFFEDSAKLPAILAYHGQAYKHLKAETLTVDDLNVAHGKLWITSFLYGLLRPLDAILPYRMEGHVELPSGEGQNMFGFWKSRLTDILIDAVKVDDGVLIHLATEEYQHLFDWQRVRKEVRIVQPLFYVRKGSNLKMQAVWAKTCRGAMTRFIIENRIDKPEDLCAFSYEGFSYEPKLGEPDYPHFIK